MNTHRNFINGQWLHARAERTFEDRNPATGELLGRFPLSDSHDVDAAVQAARGALEAWSAIPAPRRGDLLFRVAERLTRDIRQLGELVVREMGKSLKEGIADVQEAIDLAYYMGSETRRMFGHTTPSELPQRLVMTVRVPVGVVGAITPWNFPIGIIALKLMPALAAGNTVVLKPAEDTPLCAGRFIEILAECGIPPGVVNLVHGTGEQAGKALVEHPGVDLISFTGSSVVGAEIAQTCGRMHKRLCMELGGKNAIVILDDADITNALTGVAWAAFGTSGQRCTATSRLIVQEELLGKVTEELAARASALKIGNHMGGNAVDVGPLVSAQQLERVSSYVEIGRKEGARVVTGGARATAGELARGHFFQPTVFANVRPDMRIAQEEIFGPVIAVMPAKDDEDALRILNGVNYGLSCAVFTRDIDRALRFVEKARAGVVYVNSHTIGAEAHVPFGGMKKSGNGTREGGWTAMDIYSEWKVIYADYSQRLQRPMLDLIEA